MKRFVLSLLASASPLIFTACCSSTSTPPFTDGGLTIRGCLAVPRDTCQTQVTLDGVLVLTGRLDGLYRAEYSCMALVQNRRHDVSPLTLQEAHIRISGAPPGSPVIASFTTAVAGVIDPDGDAGSSGVGATVVSLIDAATAAKLTQAAADAKASQHVAVTLSVSGVTADGTEVESNDFVFPIKVCAGCSCTMPVGDLCVGSEQKPAVDCLLGQDDNVDCRQLGAMDACQFLECQKDASTNKSLLETARCPAEQGGADGSCCDP